MSLLKNYRPKTIIVVLQNLGTKNQITFLYIIYQKKNNNLLLNYLRYLKNRRVNIFDSQITKEIRSKYTLDITNFLLYVLSYFRYQFLFIYFLQIRYLQQFRYLQYFEYITFKLILFLATYKQLILTKDSLYLSKDKYLVF